jgi:predicted RND superfamily exporter protein
MISLFASIRMIFISIVPSLIPLLITAGLMGYLGINLKPSTILIFSIAFGIASDGTLYFLTKYRHELKNNNSTISKAVSVSIKEVGLSMIFTAIILACGFGIFTASTFGGTKAVGFLIPVTLIFAYASNLILLPSFLLSLEKYITKKEVTEKPLFEIDQEESLKEEEYKDLKID